MLMKSGAILVFTTLLYSVLCSVDEASPKVIDENKINDSLPGGGTKEVLKYGETEIIAYINKGDPKTLIRNELAIIKEIQALGFLTQQNAREMTCLRETNSKTVEETVLVMSSWEHLATLGIQVRDGKNSESSYGKTMIFGTKENVNKERIMKIMTGLSEEMYKLMVNGIFFGGDAYNLAIVDKEGSPALKEGEPDIYDESRHEIKLFLSDFTSIDDFKDWKAKNYKYIYDQRTKQLSRKNLQDVVGIYVYGSCAELILCGLKKEERKELISGENFEKFYGILREVNNELRAKLMERVYNFFDGKYDEFCGLHENPQHTA